MPGAGFEPARPLEQWILNPPSLPFLHPGGPEQRNLGAMFSRRLTRFAALAALVAAVAAFRSWRLNDEEKKFNR